MSSPVKRVGYAKLGRSLSLDMSKGDMAGNAEAYNILIRLAERNPDVEWYVLGKNSGSKGVSLPPNVINPWPDGSAKSPWLYDEECYRCAFCRAAAPRDGSDLECCERAREYMGIENYVTALTVQMDALVMHAGQHGTSHAPLPFADDTWASGKLTNPFAWARNYGQYLVNGINKFADAHNGAQDRMVWIISDPRNYMKARDIKWPTGLMSDQPILSQYSYDRESKHDRFRDPRTPQELGVKGSTVREGEVWSVQHSYRYSGLEISMLPDDWETWGATPYKDRVPISVATTAAYFPKREMRRSAMVQDWIFSQFPNALVHGKWADKCFADITGEVKRDSPLKFSDNLAAGRATVSLPAAGSITNGMRWVVAKPYQCFAARTACFFVPPVDAQGWVIPNTRSVDGSKRVADGLYSMRDDWTVEELQLARWLRVQTPADLKKRVDALAVESTWEWIVNTQRALVKRRWDAHELETAVEKRLNLTPKENV